MSSQQNYCQLVKSNAFIGMEQYQQSVSPATPSSAPPSSGTPSSAMPSSGTLSATMPSSATPSSAKLGKATNAIKGNSATKNNFKRKGEESSELQTAKKSKIAKDATQKRSGKNGSKMLTVKSENIKCSVTFSEQMKMQSSVTVSSNGFYQKMYYQADATRNKRRATDELTMDRKRQKTSYGTDASKSQVTFKCSVKINCGDNKQSKSSTEAKAENVTFFPVVRCNAFIGPDQYRERKKTVLSKAALCATQANREKKTVERHVQCPTQIMSTKDAGSINFSKKSTSQNSSSKKLQINAKTTKERKITKSASEVDLNKRITSESSADESQISLVSTCKQRQTQITTPKTIKHSVAEAEAATFPSLVRCNAFIGPDQYRERKKAVLNKAAHVRATQADREKETLQRHVRFPIQKMSTKDAGAINFSKKSTSQNSSSKKVQMNSKTTKERKFTKNASVVDLNKRLTNECSADESQIALVSACKQRQTQIVTPKSIKHSVAEAEAATFQPLVRCNAFIGPEQYRERMNEEQTVLTLAKSELRKRKMPRQRLLRMNEAIQQWNGFFGTGYTIL